MASPVESNFDIGDFSLFFTEEKEREGIGKSASSSDPAPSSSSRRPYSRRIQEMINGEIPEIGFSESQLTETGLVTGSELVTDSELGWDLTRKENEEVFRRLQDQDATGGFFKRWDGLEMGEKFAKGGQAHVYEASVVGSGKKRALKVFKPGFELQDLRKQWPLSFFPKLHPENPDHPGYFNPVLHGRLLDDGRFAFEMLRWWGDLRKLLDKRMLANGNQRHPFQMPNGKYLECCMFFMMWQIAWALEHMHRDGILHRDLKTSNVFIDSVHSREKDFNPLQFDDHDFLCRVGDFESSIGHIGTGFWRAPDILEVLKDTSRNPADRHNGFVAATTTKSDVYSYGMTCYEILTGYEPFEVEGLRQLDYDYVLAGNRPELPRIFKPWIKDLLTKCWHPDPSRRPTFVEIRGILDSEYTKSREECSLIEKYYVLHVYGC